VHTGRRCDRDPASDDRAWRDRGPGDAQQRGVDRRLTEIHSQVAQPARERFRFEQPACADAAFDTFGDREGSPFDRVACGVDRHEQGGFALGVVGLRVVAQPRLDAGARPEDRSALIDDAFTQPVQLDGVVDLLAALQKRRKIAHQLFDAAGLHRDEP